MFRRLLLSDTPMPFKRFYSKSLIAKWGSFFIKMTLLYIFKNHLSSEFLTFFWLMLVFISIHSIKEGDSLFKSRETRPLKCYALRYASFGTPLYSWLDCFAYFSIFTACGSSATGWYISKYDILIHYRCTAEFGTISTLTSTLLNLLYHSNWISSICLCAILLFIQCRYENYLTYYKLLLIF